VKLAPWQEELLVLWWRVDLSENALNALVEAHRPMVVSMAQKNVGTKRKLLIEYGMFGLRLAATRQWANGRKKGATAGFDPAKGYRFSTYARHQAKRLMREAARGDRYGPPQHLQDTKTEFADWSASPIPIEIERQRANLPRWEPWDEIAEIGPQLRVGQDYDFAREINPNKRIKQVRQVRAEFGIECEPWWLEPDETEVKKRRSKHTELEQNNRKQYYQTHGYKLATFDAVAKDGLGGWEKGEDGGDDRGGEAFEFEVHWEPCTGAFKDDKYKLPLDVLIWRWKLAKARYGTAVPYAVNDGLGLYDKFGARLPHFDLRPGKVKRSRGTPPICLRPVAGIYLVRAGEIPANFRRCSRLPTRSPPRRPDPYKSRYLTERGFHHVTSIIQTRPAIHGVPAGQVA
jgi:hypothetical protein